MRTTACLGAMPKEWQGMVPGVDGELEIKWWYRWEKKGVFYGMMVGGVGG